MSKFLEREEKEVFISFSIEDKTVGRGNQSAHAAN